MWQTDENKMLVFRYVEAYNSKNLAALDDILASTYIDHAQPDGQPAQPPGPAFKKQIFALFFQSFPDAYLTIEDLIVEGDKIVARMMLSGTHRGAFMGIQPKGRRFSVPTINIFLIRGGKITDSWAVLDMMTLIQQIKGPKMVEFLWGEDPSLSQAKSFAFEVARSAPAPEYWARWEYSEEEWRRYDQVDWGRIRNTLVGVVVGVLLFWMGVAAFIVMQFLAASPYASQDYFTLVFFIPLVVILPSLLISYALVGRQFLEARKRHKARQTGPRKVTIGNLTSFKDQGLWVAGFFVPLQGTFLTLSTMKMTENPPVLHLRRKHLEIRQSSWHDTVHILLPQGHEEEATELVERFRAETIASRKKGASPSEPL